MIEVTSPDSIRNSGPGLLRRAGVGLAWIGSAVLLLILLRASYPRAPILADPHPAGDALYFYAFCRSLLFDQDIDLANDYAILGDPYRMGTNSETGRAQNCFSLGPALFWMPGGVAVRAWYAAAGRETNQGADPGFALAVVRTGSIFWGLAGAYLVFCTCRSIAGLRTAWVASLALTFASPLSWYLWSAPGMSHAVDMFTGALYLLVWLRTLGQRGSGRFVMLGFLLGLAACVRPQNVTHGVLIGGELLALAASRVLGDVPPRPAWFAQRLAAAGAGFATAFSPQMAAWKAMYGSPLLIPQGGGFMHWGQSRWGEALFSARHGLFAWHPLLYLGAAGLLISLWQHRGNPKLRIAAGLGLVALLLQAYVNGAADDWYGGWSYGGRRFSSSLPLLGLGLAMFLEATQRWLRGHSHQLVRVLVLALPLSAIWMNFSMQRDYAEGRLDPANAIDLRSVWRRGAGRAVDAVYLVTGNWGSVPANWVFAWRAKVSPPRYDFASGAELEWQHGQATLSFVGQQHAMAGFGSCAQHLGRPGRTLPGHSGCWVFALRVPLEVEGEIELAAVEGTARLEMSIRGARVFDERIRAGWASYPLHIPRTLLGTGVNYVDLRVTQAPGDSEGNVGFAGEDAVPALPYEVRLESAGLLVGNRASVTIEGRTTEVAGRGITLFVLSPSLPQSRLLGTYDAFADPFQMQALQVAVAALPDGTVVAAVVKDDVSTHWDTTGDHVLRTLGGTSSLIDHFRASYALLGIKGARPGSALEDLRGEAPAQVVCGPRPRGLVFGRTTLRQVRR
jgi:hypothetical protein